MAAAPAKPIAKSKLRFPEFIGQPFRERRLGDVTAESVIRNGSDLPAASVMGVSKVDGIVPMDEHIIASDIARYKVVRKDWFAYNPMRLNIGSIARWQGEPDILVSPDYVVFQCLDDDQAFGIEPDYLDHLRHSESWDAFVSEGGDGGVRVRIYYKDLARLELVLPGLVEQRKIADCLTSLDDMIDHQAQKAEALKTYKFGLAQQLFPREGEAVPRLRFPEFLGRADWREGKLSDTVDLVSGMHLSPLEYGATGDTPYFTGPSDFTNDVGQVKKWTRASRSIASQHDIMITVKGSGVGEIWYLEMVSVAMGRQLMSVRAKTCSSRFIFQLLKTKRTRFQDLAAGNLIPGLARGDILNLVVLMPETDEQQQVADCLGTLDDSIGAELAKLEGLKAYRKGLAQQLLPFREEV